MSEGRAGRVDVGERRMLEKAGVPLRSALIAFAVFYVAAGILNGRALHERAQKRPYGWVRDVWVAATKPLYWLSTKSGADRFRAWIESWTGEQR